MKSTWIALFLSACLLSFSVNAMAGGKRVSFTKSRTITLHGTLYWPTSPAALRPGVIALGGCDASKSNSIPDSLSEAAWAKRLTKQGIMVLLLDNNSTECDSTHAVMSSDKFTDIIAARKYLDSRTGVDGDEISLMGWSHGATTVLQVIARSALPHSSLKDFSSAVAFSPDCSQLANEKNAYVTQTSLFILMSNTDSAKSISACQKLVAKSNNDFANTELLIYHASGTKADGSAESSTASNEDEIINKIFLFLKEPWNYPARP